MSRVLKRAEKGSAKERLSRKGVTRVSVKKATYLQEESDAEAVLVMNSDEHYIVFC